MKTHLCPSLKKVVDASLDAAFLFDVDGVYIYKNLRALQTFHCGESIDGGSNVTFSSYFMFVEQNQQGWYDVLADLRNERGSNDLSQPAEPAEFDAKAFDESGDTFEITISLAILDNECSCCSVLDRRASEALVEKDARPQTPLVVAYVRENSDRQQHFVRYLEKEIRRLQSTQSAMDASFDAFIAIDPSGKILNVNKATSQIFGYAQKELIGKNITIIMNKDDGKKHAEYIRRYMDTGVKKMIGVRRELEAVHKDGFSIPVELGLVELKSEYGEETVFCSFIRDLSLQKGHEHNIKNKEMLTGGLIDSSFDPVFLVTSNGTIELANKAASDLFGYSNSEFIGQNISIICNDKDASQHLTYMEKYAKTGVAHVIGKKRPLLAKKRNGKTFSIVLGLQEMKLSTGKTYFAGYVRDLTSEKIAEEKLTTLIEASFDPVVLISDNGTIELANRATCSVFGYSKDEIIGENISLLCNDKDGPRHDDYIKRYLVSGQKCVMGTERELAAKKKDGTIFPIQLGLTEAKIDHGARSIFCGFIHDLTQQKLDQDRIQRKQEIMNGLISSSFDPIFLINERGIIQIANQAAVDHFGYSMDELQGSNISLIAGRGHDEHMQRYLRTGEKRVIGRRRQVIATAKDGCRLPIELGIQEVTTVWGEKMFCGFARDIRREQFDEKELREQELISEAIVEAMAEALLTIDGTGKIYRANREAVKFFGYSKEDLLNANLSVLVGQKERTDEGSDVASIINRSRGRSRVVEMRKKCGTLHEMELKIVEINGVFPLTHGLSHGTDNERGTHLFAAFLREAKSGESVNHVASIVGNISEGFRNLGVLVEQNLIDSQDANESSQGLGNTMEVLTGSLKSLVGKKGDNEGMSPEEAQ